MIMKQINTDKNQPPSLPARKQIRLTGYDYSLPGYYFVTVCTQEKKISWERLLMRKSC